MPPICCNSFFFFFSIVPVWSRCLGKEMIIPRTYYSKFQLRPFPGQLQRSFQEGTVGWAQGIVRPAWKSHLACNQLPIPHPINSCPLQLSWPLAGNRVASTQRGSTKPAMLAPRTGFMARLHDRPAGHLWHSYPF